MVISLQSWRFHQRQKDKTKKSRVKKDHRLLIPRRNGVDTIGEMVELFMGDEWTAPTPPGVFIMGYNPGMSRRKRRPQFHLAIGSTAQ
jgi:hypothetical protein